MNGMKKIAMLAGRESAMMTKAACIEGLGTFLIAHRYTDSRQCVTTVGGGIICRLSVCS